MARRELKTSGTPLNAKQKKRLNELMSDPRYQTDPAFRAEVRQSIEDVVGTGDHHEEVHLEDGLHDLDRKMRVVIGGEEEIERFLGIKGSS